MFPGFSEASHFFPFFFFASSPSSETESLTKLDRLVCPLPFLCTSGCVSESSVTQWCGFALNLLLWKSLLLLSVLVVAWLQSCLPKSRECEGCTCALGVGCCRLCWLSLFLTPFLPVSPLQWMRRVARGGGTVEKPYHLKRHWRAIQSNCVLCPWSLFPGSLSSSTP